MEQLTTVFEQLTQAQADVIVAATTLASAIIVAVVAPLTFHLLTRRGVRGFEQSVEALTKSAARAEDQATGIGDVIGQIRGSVGELQILVSSLQEGVANTQNALVENSAQSPANNSIGSNREKVKALWRELQDMVEQLASNPDINGNTRARYARVDRRGYLNLVSMLQADGRLGGTEDQWREAYFLWNAARLATAQPNDDDLARMHVLVEILKGAQTGRPKSNSLNSFASTLKRPVPRQTLRIRDEDGPAVPQAPN